MSNIPNSAMPHAGGTSNADSRQTTDFASNAGGSSQSRSFTGSEQRQGSSETFSSVREHDSGTLLDRAREHKTGIAVGVAVGAIAAAAIPFMFAGRKRSSERQDYSTDRQSDLYVDSRDTSARGGTGTRSY